MEPALRSQSDVAEVVALGDGDDYGQYGGILYRGGDAAAGLPMIITVNATVCVIGTRVSDQRFMIICSERGRRVPEGEKTGVSRRKGNVKVDEESVGSCQDSALAAGALRVRRCLTQVLIAAAGRAPQATMVRTWRTGVTSGRRS